MVGSEQKVDNVKNTFLLRVFAFFIVLSFLGNNHNYVYLTCCIAIV